MAGSSLGFSMGAEWSELRARAGEGLVFLFFKFFGEIVAEALGQRLSKREKCYG
jgi:hypothetical protein